MRLQRWEPLQETNLTWQSFYHKTIGTISPVILPMMVMNLTSARSAEVVAQHARTTHTGWPSDREDEVGIAQELVNQWCK
jgi:hypothetical protein